MIGQNRQSIFRGVGIIIVSVIISATVLATFLNQRCQSRFRDGLLYYPGAEIITEEYPFLATQRVELYSVDAPETVQAWYNSQRAAAMRERVVSGDFSELPPENWIISPAVNREGSAIVLSVTCP